MRHPPFDPTVKKRTGSLTLNVDLRAKARALRLNESQSAETDEADIEQDMAAYDAYVEKHGSPAAMLRDWLAKRDGAA